MTTETTPKKKRVGLAAMSPEQRKAIASAGGKAAHAMGRAHTFTPEEAKEAGRKGGLAAQANGKTHRYTSETGREAGKKGGRAAHAKGVAHKFTTESAKEAGRKGGRANGTQAPSETVVEGAVEVTPAILPRITHATITRDDGSRLVITPKTVRATGKAADDLVRALGGAGGSGVRR